MYKRPAAQETFPGQFHLPSTFTERNVWKHFQNTCLSVVTFEKVGTLIATTYCSFETFVQPSLKTKSKPFSLGEKPGDKLKFLVPP